MERRNFGTTGRQVAAIGQGTWYIDRGDRAEAVDALRRGLDLGLTHVDTAEMYGDAEEIVGEVIAGRRDDVFLVAHPGYRGATRSSIKDPSRALPRLRALCTNSKNPRYSESLSCEIPRWGRSHEPSSDQNPSIVSTWTSQKPSPSSSRANSPA